MKNINRRSWMKLAGLAGSASILAPVQSYSNPDPTVLIDNSGDNGGIAKLSFNENPFAPSAKVREAITRSFGDGCRYPFMKIAELEKQIAEREGVQANQVIITGGSTEGLKATGLTMGVNGGEIIAADPTYQSLLSYAKQFGAFINRVPLNEQLEHDLDEMEKRVHADTKLVFVCNPNNPSGTIIEKDRLKDFCESVSERTIVFSDEAYFDYVTEPNYPSMISLVHEGANLIVSRTFSKVYGLAGLRIGYLVARPDIARRIRPNVMAGTNMLAVAAATQAIADQSFYEESLKRNYQAKEHIYSVLDNLGLRYVKSHTNFVFFHTGKPIQWLIEKMRAKDVWVGRPFPPLTDWCRISTGTMPHIERFGTALTEVMT